MKNGYYIILLLLIIVISCKKEGELKPSKTSVPSPAFFVKGNIGREQINLTAGVNDYYMYTNHYIDSFSNVIVVEGRLRKNNCTSCPNDLTILLSYPTNNINVMNFDDSLLFSSFRSPHPSHPYGIDTGSFSVRYANMRNETYTSFTNLSTDTTSYFNITGVSDYQLNVNGQKTKTVNFQLLNYIRNFNSTPFVTDTITLQGTFSFAYPS